MQDLEISARTVEEAIQKALDKLNVGREEVEVVVLNEGKSGVLGLGAEEAKVIVRPLLSASPDEDIESAEEVDIAETARDILEELLEKLGMVASIEEDSSQVPAEGEETPAPVAFDIKGVVGIFFCWFFRSNHTSIAIYTV